MARIVQKKGLEPLEIYFEDIDKTETIYFNPSDSNLPKRLMECQKMIEEKSKEIKPYETDENGVPNADSAIDYFNEINKVVCDALDYAFGNQISDVVFKYCGPFSVVDGNYQILNFLQAITPELEKIIKKNNQTANNKANKYLKKYYK